MQSRSSRLVTIPHLRQPWGGDEVVFVCVRWGRLRGTDESVRYRLAFREYYRRAKSEGDFDAAAIIVKSCIDRSEDTMDRIVDKALPAIKSGRPIICVTPHPGFDDVDGADEDIASRPLPRNVIPIVYANYLAEMIGATVDEEILERERVGRTKLNGFERFLWQPSFIGEINQDAVYIIVDDVCTLGGTIASLRSHILRAGGTVIQATTLANKEGKECRLALTPQTWDALQDLYGTDLDSFWKEEIGHAATDLTEPEGALLTRWASEVRRERASQPLLQRLRTHLLEIAASGGKSEGERRSP